MKLSVNAVRFHPRFLFSEPAAALMSPDLLTIDDQATITDAAVLFADQGIDAAIVLDAARRPVGVLTCADIVQHTREKAGHVQMESTRVGEIMTDVILSVSPETPAWMVVEQMMVHRVHQVFVADDEGTLVGMIDALDLLRPFQGGPRAARLVA